MDVLLAISTDTGKALSEINMVTGVVVPQTCVNLYEYVTVIKVRSAEAIFFTDCSGFFRFARSYKDILEGAKMGVRLQDALKLGRSALAFDGERDGDTMEAYSRCPLKFVVHVSTTKPLHRKDED